MGMPYTLGGNEIMGVEVCVVWVFCMICESPSDEVSLLGMGEKCREDD